MGAAAFRGSDGGLGGALVGSLIGAALGWTKGTGFAAALAWRPPNGAAELAPPSWARTLSAAAIRLRMPVAIGLGLAALPLFAHSVDAAVTDVKTANLVPGTFAAACALAYLAWAVHGACLAGLGRAVRVPAEIGGPLVGRAVTFARRWRVPVVAALIFAGSGLVAQSFSATYIRITYREHRDTHTERRSDGTYRVTRTTYTPVRHETGGETIWVALIAGGLLLLGARRLHRGRDAREARAAPAPAV
jgi:hypothetical protein